MLGKGTRNRVSHQTGEGYGLHCETCVALTACFPDAVREYPPDMSNPNNIALARTLGWDAATQTLAADVAATPGPFAEFDGKDGGAEIAQIMRMIYTGGK